MVLKWSLKDLTGTNSYFNKNLSPDHFYLNITLIMIIWTLGPMTHSWFIWFRRGISLKFPRWFIKWFIDFGPVPTIFPIETIEAYNYFSEKSSFVSGYCLISFVASQAIT
ncbi:hypothetical protein CR513_22423, partial [Mucuna pruriens]